MNNTSNTMTIAEFERLLDVYGSDRTRWPVEARASAGQLVARDRAARRLLAEAEALDRALERAPLPTLAQEAAIAERIVAAARRSPRIVSPARSRSGPAGRHLAADNVVQLPAARGRPRWLDDQDRVRRRGGRARRLARARRLPRSIQSVARRAAGGRADDRHPARLQQRGGGANRSPG